MKFKIAVLPGDGIGPEVIAQAVRVLETIGEKYGHTFEFAEAMVGGQAIDATGTALPPETLALCKKSDAVLLGAVGGPKWDDPKAAVRPEQGLLGLRKGLGLFANLRPVRVLPMLLDSTTIKPEVLKGVDIIVIRELTGGLYFGKPSKRWTTARGRRAVDTLVYSEQEVARIVRVGCELARQRRKKLTSVDKANVLSSSRLWREVAQEVASEYPDVAFENMLVDTCAMQLIRRPASFDVIVTENMFGDILTDEASVLAGSMGMLPSASLGPTTGGQSGTERRFGMYEPIHGSAPGMAGQNKANPLATILSAAMLLRYSCALPAEAAAIERAVEAVVAQGVRTYDIPEPGKPVVSTAAMGDAVIAAIKDSLGS